MVNYKSTHPFEKYFHFEEAKIDVGLLKFEESSSAGLAKAYFDYSLAVDLERGRDLEIVELRAAKSVVLPKSVRNRSKIVYAGNTPIFASFDEHFNLITYMIVGSVVRVEYLGKKGEKKKVKYFKYW